MPFEDYLGAYNNFKKKNYQYRQIVDTDTANELIEKGRKIVLPNSNAQTNAVLYFGSCFLGIIIIIILLLLSGLIESAPKAQALQYPGLAVLIFLFIAICMGILVILGLVERKDFFYILGPEGIVFKRFKKDMVKFTPWNNIKNIIISDIRHSKTSSKLIEILLKDYKKLKIDTYYLNSKEFRRFLMPYDRENLIVFAIKKYYECYNNK